MKTNTVWTPENGWHDGPPAHVSLDQRGRLATQVFTGTPVEDTLGGLSLTPTLTGDPSVIAWLAVVSTSGRAW